MIMPMMMKVDFGAIRDVGRRPRGLVVTLFVNWLVKPFSMAAIAWLFFRVLFAPWIPPTDADQYIAGCIILAAAPCTAMVFVWSYLTDGDPAYTLVQVSVNDLIMLVLFAPIVRFLVSGASSLEVPVHRAALLGGRLHRHPAGRPACCSATVLIAARGREWFEQVLLPRFAPVSMAALLATLVLIFAFQADNITSKTLHVALIAVPILIQVYFNSSLTYGLMRLFRVEYAVAAPGRADRREQLLRAGGGDGHRAVRPGVGRGAGHGGRRAHRGAGDARGVRRLQPHAALVPGRRLSDRPPCCRGNER